MMVAILAEDVVKVFTLTMTFLRCTKKLEIDLARLVANARSCAAYVVIVTTVFLGSDDARAVNSAFVMAEIELL